MTDRPFSFGTKTLDALIRKVKGAHVAVSCGAPCAPILSERRFRFRTIVRHLSLDAMPSDVAGADPLEPHDTDALFPVVYEELKRIAHQHLRTTGNDATLCTTELVHETFLKLASDHGIGWAGRAHFFGAASRAMRQILVDFARRRQTLKRGGDWQAVPLRDADGALEVEMDSVLALDRILTQLDAFDGRLSRVVELRFFGGLPELEVAELLGVSARTVERDWLKAKMFLVRELEAADLG